MIEPKDLTEEQLEWFDEFLKVTFLMTQEEQKALDKQIPMTQELFDRCCDRLSEIGAEKQFYQLLFDYPDFMIERADELEKELNLSEVDMPEMTQEQLEESYHKLMERIRKGIGIGEG